MWVIWWRSSQVLISPTGVFRFAEGIERALDEKIQGERETCEAVGKDAVVNVATCGVIAGDGRGPLPGFAAAARVLIVAISECLAADKPKALKEEERKQSGRDTLRQVEAEAAKDSEPVGHHVSGTDSSLNRQGWVGSVPLPVECLEATLCGPCLHDANLF